jgi:hypothetical protein
MSCIGIVPGSERGELVEDEAQIAGANLVEQAVDWESGLLELDSPIGKLHRGVERVVDASDHVASACQLFMQSGVDGGWDAISMGEEHDRPARSPGQRGRVLETVCRKGQQVGRQV